MKRFVVLYRAPLSAMEQMAQASPDQAKAGMDAWMSWSREAGAAVVDLGMPLGNGVTLRKGAPPAGSNSGGEWGQDRAGQPANQRASQQGDQQADQIVGYSILSGQSMAEVVELMQRHPHLSMPGFSVELLESLPMPGM